MSQGSRAHLHYLCVTSLHTRSGLVRYLSPVIRLSNADCHFCRCLFLFGLHTSCARTKQPDSSHFLHFSAPGQHSFTFPTWNSHLVPFDELAPLLQRFVDGHGFELQRVDSRLGPSHGEGLPARVPTPKPRLRRAGLLGRNKTLFLPPLPLLELLFPLFPGRGLIGGPSGGRVV